MQLKHRCPGPGAPTSCLLLEARPSTWKDALAYWQQWQKLAQKHRSVSKRMVLGRLRKSLQTTSICQLVSNYSFREVSLSSVTSSGTKSSPEVHKGHLVLLPTR